MPWRNKNALKGDSAAAEISQRLGSQFHQVAIGPERLMEHQAVISGRRPCDYRETPVRPIKCPGVDDHAADAGPMAADEFRGGMDNDIGTPFERAAQVGRGKGVVDDQRQLVFMRHRCHRLDVENVPARVADCLREKRLGVVTDRLAPGIGVVRVDPCQLHAHFPQQMLELVDRAAVQSRGRNNMVARLQQSKKGGGLGRDAARERHRAATTLEVRHPFLEHGHGGVHDPGVGVPVLLQVEICRRRFRILEHIARRLEIGTARAPVLGSGRWPA